MNHAPAREAHELWMQVGQYLCQILAHAVTLVGILRIERNNVDVELTLLLTENIQRGVLEVLSGRDGTRIFLPFAATDLKANFTYCNRAAEPVLGRLGQ